MSVRRHYQGTSGDVFRSHAPYLPGCRTDVEHQAVAPVVGPDPFGVGGYPEKHFEAPNLQLDARRVKEKVDAGAHYVVTQMFFDNRHYFHFVELCSAIGVAAPIIPGLKVLSSQKQLATIPSNFHVEVPAELSDEVLAARPEHVLDIGVEWARRQLEELLAHGVPSAHFYVMQSATAIKRLMAKIDL